MARQGPYTLGGENPPKSTYYEQGKFGRIFPMLPPFATDTATVRNAPEELGKKGGVMDAADETDIVANPDLVRDLITDPALNVNNPNNTALTAGMTFLGQCLDHDMTFDKGLQPGTAGGSGSHPNFLEPLLELDIMYGSGPAASRTSTTKARTAKASSSS